MNPLVQVMALIQTLYFNTLNAGLFFWGNKNTLPFPFISWHWDGSSDWNPSSWKTSTVQCCYNKVNFLQIPHNGHPIAQPWGWGMGCLLWIQILIYVLPQWLEYCMSCCIGPRYRHRENIWVFTRPKRNFGLILLISNMIIHRSFTGPTHLLSANVQGLVSFAVSDVITALICTHLSFIVKTMAADGLEMLGARASSAIILT